MLRALETGRRIGGPHRRLSGAVMNEHWQPRREAAGTVAMPLHRHSIVFLGTAHDGGGSSVLASTLASAMRGDGHHVEEWYLFGSYADTPPGARVFLNQRRSRSPITLAALFARIVNALRERQTDAGF